MGKKVYIGAEKNEEDGIEKKIPDSNSTSQSISNVSGKSKILSSDSTKKPMSNASEKSKIVYSDSTKKPMSNVSEKQSLVPDHEEETLLTQFNQMIENLLLSLSKSRKEYIADKEKEFYEVTCNNF